MQSKPAYILSCVIAGLAGAQAAPPVAGSEPEWRCVAAPGGGWQCAAAAPVAITPATPAAQTEPVSSVTAEPTAPAVAAAPTEDRAAAAPAPSVATGEAAADELSESMDWVPRAGLSAAQAAQAAPQCGGAYVEPPPGASPSATGVLGSIHASADQSELLQDPDIAKFSGNVTLRQGDRRLRADQAIYYRERNQLDIDGHVQYREPGLLVRGNSATIDTAQDSGVLHDARFVMHPSHTRGEASEVKRNVDRTLDLQETVYTQCAPGNNDWELVSETLHIDRDAGQGTAHHARLEIKDVPVFYTPYIRFPVGDQRMSGFLWPTFANSSQNGFDVTAPYYFNLAPNYDATLLPRYMNDRGAMLGGEFRYMNHWSNWVASGAILPNDEVANEDRWITSLQQTGTPLERVSTRISYTEVSDEDYLRQLNSSGLEVQRSTHLPQLAHVSYVIGNEWTASALAQQFQMLDRALAEPYKMLPRVSLNRAFRGTPFEPDYSVTSEITAFEHKDPTELTGQRLYLQSSVGYPMEWAAAFVRPTLGYQTISYKLDDNSAVLSGNDSPSVGAPLFSLDSGYFLERDTRLLGKEYLQTLEPRAYYLWAQREEQDDLPNFDSSDLTFSFSQLFRTTRFSGHDRIADANQGSLSVTTRLVDDGGTERVTASIGQIFYFENRLVTVCQDSARAQSQPSCQAWASSAAHGNGLLGGAQYDSSSEIAAETQLLPMNGLTVSATTLWDAHRDQFNEGGVAVHLTPDEQTIVNVGYRYRREMTAYDLFGNPLTDNIDQMDVSTVLPLGDSWRVFARYQYDFTNDHSLEELTGVEYSSCCWAVRMVYQEGLNWDQGREYGVYLQFILRGLGGLGKNIDQLLQDSIFGYVSKQEEYGLAN